MVSFGYWEAATFLARAAWADEFCSLVENEACHGHVGTQGESDESAKKRQVASLHGHVLCQMLDGHSKSLTSEGQWFNPFVQNLLPVNLDGYYWNWPHECFFKGSETFQPVPKGSMKSIHLNHPMNFQKRRPLKNRPFLRHLFESLVPCRAGKDVGRLWPLDWSKSWGSPSQSDLYDPFQPCFAQFAAPHAMLTWKPFHWTQRCWWGWRHMGPRWPGWSTWLCPAAYALEVWSR